MPCCVSPADRIQVSARSNKLAHLVFLDQNLRVRGSERHHEDNFRPHHWSPKAPSKADNRRQPFHDRARIVSLRTFALRMQYVPSHHREQAVS